jgi:hypothetical protein
LGVKIKRYKIIQTSLNAAGGELIKLLQEFPSISEPLLIPPLYLLLNIFSVMVLRSGGVDVLGQCLERSWGAVTLRGA